jgi:hypothetical protein
MSDDNFYGREEALNIDLDACYRAAILEAKNGFDSIVHGNAKLGGLLIRQARVKLAIVIGNEARAMEYLSSHPLPPVFPWPGTPGRKESGADKDAEEFERGVNRQHAHPGLVEKLEEIKEAIVAARREQN